MLPQRFLTGSRAFVLAWSWASALNAQPVGPSTGLDLFREGRFAEAKQALSSEMRESPSAAAAALLGHLSLLENDFESARSWLARANKIEPDAKAALKLLAEACYRQDRFAEASVLFERLGRKPMAELLASFGDQRPYEVVGEGTTSVVPFQITDPLPVVQVIIDGGEPASFLIDTGGAELIVDSEFAEQLKLKRFGKEVGVFGGDRPGSIEFSRIDSIRLGTMEVRHVPVRLMRARRFSGLMGRQIDGIIGTVFLYHFRSTLDYPAGRLVLERLDAAAPAPEAPLESVVQVPFWLAADHVLVAPGTANNSKPYLWFVDTGAMGTAFLPSKQTITDLGIALDPKATAQGLGGGGAITVTPFVLDRLSVGSASKDKVAGIAGAFPESLSEAVGFRVGGIVSHTFFRSYAVTFDFRRMQLILRPGT